MKFSSILFALVTCLFLSESTFALPAPKCRIVCKAAKAAKATATHPIGKMALGAAAAATGMGAVYVAAKMANQVVSGK
jgi:hypothetical protein